MPAPHELGRLYETSLPADVRRRGGVHYTPPAIAADLVARAVEALGRVPRRVLDPTCGGGVLLLAALDVLVASGIDPVDALERVHGIDVDPGAVEVTTRAVRDWAVAHGVDPDVVVAPVLGDALVVDWPAGIDLVVGNPPFGGQLRGTTVRDDERSTRARSILGRRSGYADTAGLFLVRAVDTVVDGGVVVLVQPTSVLAARDAATVRRRVDDRATVHDVVFPDSAAFDASVQVCAPVIVRDRPDPADAHDESPVGVEWSDIAADALGLAPAPTQRRRVLGDVATITAGFRDEFYSVARFVHESDGAEGTDGDPGRSRGRWPHLITSGAIEPGRVRWGESPTTVLRRRFDRPVVDVDGLRRWARGPDGSTRLAALVESRCAPKVLVATQTRALEAVADPDGCLWPSVPVVSVLPGAVDVWWLLAVLVSREATAWMRRRMLGTGLSSGALRVSARVLSDLPVPDGDGAWRDAADALAAGAAVDAPIVLAAMSRAYGAPPDAVRRRGDGSG